MPDYITPDALLAVLGNNNTSRFEMTLAQLGTYIGTAKVVIAGGAIWVWQATGVANGDNIRAASVSKGGVWVRQGNTVVTGGSTTDVDPLINQDVFATEGGHPQADYKVSLGRRLTVNTADTLNRFWTVIGAVTVPRGAVSKQDHSGVRGQIIIGASGGRGWGVVGLAQTEARQLTGTVYVTNGTGAVTGLNSKFTTELAPGEILRVLANGDERPTGARILSIQSDTALTLEAPWTRATTNNVQGYGHPWVGSTGADRLLAWTAEFDTNNNSGFDAQQNVGLEIAGTAFVSGGVNMPTYGWAVFKSGLSAPFFNGALFKDNGVYNAAIMMHNINPQSGGLVYGDAYGGAIANSIKNGVVNEYRDPAGNMYHWAQNGKHIFSAGVNGLGIQNQARNEELWTFRDNGDLVSDKPGGVIFLRSLNANPLAFSLGNDGYFRAGTKVIPTQAAAQADVAAGATLGQLITAYNTLLAALRAAGVLAP